MEQARTEYPKFNFLTDKVLSAALNDSHVAKLTALTDILEVNVCFGPHNLITSVISTWGERLELCIPVSFDGNFATVAKNLEQAMKAAVRADIASAIADVSYYSNCSLLTKLQRRLGATSLLMLGVCHTQQLERGDTQLARHILSELVYLAKRRDLDELTRKKLRAMITLTVFYNTSQDSLKYRIVDGQISIERGSDKIIYGYCFTDFSRLVITPLTVIAYNHFVDCLVKDKFSCAHGPAGTGKTETIKDLAKTLGRQCRIINSTDELNAEMIEKMLQGCSDENMWVCFDEFNHMKPKVLNECLKLFKKYKDVKLFCTFNPECVDGFEIPECMAEHFSVTGNPGLVKIDLVHGAPETSESIDFGIPMTVPDYALIAEVMLFCQGIHQATMISNKLCEAFDHFEENCSKQSHYDFGLRTLKMVCNSVGKLHRNGKEIHPKVSDCGIARQFKHAMDITIAAKLSTDDLHIYKTWIQSFNRFNSKLIALRKILKLRHSAIVITSQANNGLIQSFAQLSDVDFEVVDIQDFSQAYGEMKEGTWTDGVFVTAYRRLLNSNASLAILKVEGDANPNTVGILNTVLDDNKCLILPNGEKLLLGQNMRILFEMENCDKQTAAFVSRNGILYL